MSVSLFMTSISAWNGLGTGRLVRGILAPKPGAGQPPPRRCRMARVTPAAFAGRRPERTVPMGGRTMATTTRPTVIALEEHYWDAEVASHFPDKAAMGGPPAVMERLNDVGALRLKEM